MNACLNCGSPNLDYVAGRVRCHNCGTWLTPAAPPEMITIIRAVLARHDGMCLDSPGDRELLAEKIAAALEESHE